MVSTIYHICACQLSSMLQCADRCMVQFILIIDTLIIRSFTSKMVGNSCKCASRRKLQISQLPGSEQVAMKGRELQPSGGPLQTARAWMAGMAEGRAQNLVLLRWNSSGGTHTPGSPAAAPLLCSTASIAGPGRPLAAARSPFVAWDASPSSCRSGGAASGSGRMQRRCSQTSLRPTCAPAGTAKFE